MAFESISFSIGMNPTDIKDAPKNNKIRLNPNALGGDSSIDIDASMWLPMASKTYNISPSLKDYVIVPVPSIISDLPNTNGDSFSREQLMMFNIQQGRMAYKTFKGKPTYKEHNNTNPVEARGVILDVYLRPLKGYNSKYLKLVKLLAFDRYKDPELCNKILRGEINTYSMGMLYKEYECSVCGFKANSSSSKCSHTNLRKPLYRLTDGRLVYRKCRYLTGFETSAVADPAYVCATSDFILNE